MSSAGGWLLVRGLDERRGLTGLRQNHLGDSRRGRNPQFPLADRFRQSAYSRLAGYEDLHDARRLAGDPTFRRMGAAKGWARGVARTSSLHGFAPAWLARAENWSGWLRLHRALVGRAAGVGSPHRGVLDRDRRERPGSGEPAQSADNGYCGSGCYPPLFLLTRQGDGLVAKWRPGHGHRAEGGAAVRLPELARQRQNGQEVVLRADAAWAQPEIDAALEERGVQDALRLPVKENRERASEARRRRPVGRPSHRPGVRDQGCFEQAASWQTARRVVAKVEFQAGELFPRVGFIVTHLALPRRAVVRFDNQRGTAEQGIQAGPLALKMTRLSCHRFRGQAGRWWLSVTASHGGNRWRRLAWPRRIGHWSLTSWPPRLVQTGGRLLKPTRYYWLLLAEGHLRRGCFGRRLRRIAALPPPDG